MIKNYLQLNNTEKQKAYGFYTRNILEKPEFINFESKMTSEIYDYGNGSLFYIHKNEVVAKIHIVLKDILQTSIAYIIDLDVIDINKSSASIIIDLISASHEISTNYNAKEIYFATNSEDIVGILQNYNIRHEHLTLIMKLNNHRDISDILKTRELDNSNKGLYKNLYNSIFIDTPHGKLISEYQLEENLTTSSFINRYYIVSDEFNKDIGVLDINIANNIGTFNIGLLKEYRGKGYGKKILDTAIYLLKTNKDVKEINLLVISKNDKAYNMYMNRGFVHKKIYSFWYDTTKFIKNTESSTM